MKKFSIVLVVLAVVALTGSAYGFKITNVTTGELNPASPGTQRYYPCCPGHAT